MKRSSVTLWLRPVLAILCLFLALPLEAAPAKPAPRKKIALEAAPSAVREAVEKAIKEYKGEFDEIKISGEGAAALYFAEIDLPQDREVKLVLREDGSLVKSIVELTPQQLPEAVRATFAKLAGDRGGIDDAAKVTEGTQVWYRAEIELPGKPDLKVKVSTEGEILEQVEEEDDD